MKIYALSDALMNLYPTALWTLKGDDYSKLDWLDTQVDKPSEATLRAEVTRLQNAWDAAEYRRLRVKDYPPIGDQLDALMKWLDTQEVTSELQGVIDWCKEVKAKYPKGGV
jgi:hypothetical protein